MLCLIILYGFFYPAEAGAVIIVKHDGSPAAETGMKVFQSGKSGRVQICIQADEGVSLCRKPVSCLREIALVDDGLFRAGK